MRLTITPGDKTVYVDGDPRVVDGSINLDSSIACVQWYDTWGEVEYNPNAQGVKPSNTRFFDVTPYQGYVTMHEAAKERDEAAEAKWREKVVFEED